MMIKNSLKQQTGSAHVVIIVVLVIALIGALGFTFWQNFTKKEDAKQTPATQTQTKPNEDNSVKAEELTEAHTIPKENLSFNYPKTWELKTYYADIDNGKSSENRALLISPNKFALAINIPNQGPGWQFGERPLACPFDEGYNGFEGGDDNHPDVCPFYSKLISQKAPNLKDLSIMAFESSWETTAIAPNISNLTLVKTGCKIPENNLCERPAAKTGYHLNVNGRYYEKISDKDKKMAYIDSGYSDVKKIKASDFIKSQDVLTAIAILKSLKY